MAKNNEPRGPKKLAVETVKVQCKAPETAIDQIRKLGIAGSYNPATGIFRGTSTPQAASALRQAGLPGVTAFYTR